MPPHVAASSREPLARSDVVPVAKARGRLCRETNHARLPGNPHWRCSDNWLCVYLRLASDRFVDNRPDDDRPTSASAEQHKPVVNWDVVGDNWHALATRVRHAWTQLAG